MNRIHTFDEILSEFQAIRLRMFRERLPDAEFDELQRQAKQLGSQLTQARRNKERERRPSQLNRMSSSSDEFIASARRKGFIISKR